MPSNAEFYAYQGTDWSVEVPFIHEDDNTKKDMTGIPIRCSIKRCYSEDMPTPLGYQVDAIDTNMLYLTLDANMTTTLHVDKYFFNLDIQEEGKWIPVLVGTLNVLPNTNHIVATAPPT